MSVIAIAAVLVLARAEANRIKAVRRGNKLINANQLKPLKEELEKWQLSAYARPVLETLWQSGLLIETETLLRPSASAYSWLQLPTALIERSLLENSEQIKLPIAPDLVSELSQHGRLATSSDRFYLPILTGIGLVQTNNGKLFTATEQAVPLLRALTYDGSQAPDPDNWQLELAYQWQNCFPGKGAGKGWLRWDGVENKFTFADPVLGKPPTFNPWQLFRLLSICEPTKFEEGRFYCQPALANILSAHQQGKAQTFILSYLTEGLRGDEPPATLVKLVRETLDQVQLLKIRELVVLESPDRKLLGMMMNERRIRTYFLELLSPRHAIVGLKSVPRLERLFKQRNIILQHSFMPVQGSNTGSKFSINISRHQLLVMGVALTLYRQELSNLGILNSVNDDLLQTIRGNLSGAEWTEVEIEASHILNSTNNREVSTPLLKIETNKLRESLETAIIQQQELWIEYSPPGRKTEVRRIEPMLLYEENGQNYLVAYCYSRQAQRTFRLDRMKFTKIGS